MEEKEDKRPSQGKRAAKKSGSEGGISPSDLGFQEADTSTDVLLNFMDRSLEMSFRQHHAHAHRTRLQFMCVAAVAASAVQWLLDIAQGTQITPILIRAATAFTLVVVFVISMCKRRKQKDGDEESPAHVPGGEDQSVLLSEEDIFIRIMCRTWPQLIVASIIAILMVAGRLFAISPINQVDEGDLSFFFLVLGGLCALSGVRYVAQLFGGILVTGLFIAAAFVWTQETFADSLETAFLVFAFVGYSFEQIERHNYIRMRKLQRLGEDTKMEVAKTLTMFAGATKGNKLEMANFRSILVVESEIKKGKLLGQGGFGVVYEGSWRGTQVAFKLLNSTVTEKLMKEFLSEALVMSKINHPHVVQLLGIGIAPRPLLVMEFMQRGSVFDVLHTPTLDLDWTLVMQWALDTARGLNFLHCASPPIFHRDLKSMNLLVNQYWRVKVADFGLTVLQKRAADVKTKDAKAQQMDVEVGTPAWAAPELFQGKEYTAKADVYSFGVILYELLTRSEPFKLADRFAIPHLVSQKKKRPSHFTPLPQIDPHLQILAKLMEACWRSDPEKRPTFSQVLTKLNKAIEAELKEKSGSFEDHVRLPVLPRSASTAGQTASEAEEISSGFNLDMKNITLGPEIGHGANATVYEGMLGQTHVAVKELYANKAPKALVIEFQKECKLMMQLRHPNIVLFLGSAQQGTRLYMITELMKHGSLFRIIHHHQKMSLTRRLKMALDGALGLQYLHSLSPQVIHRDLKSPNVLIGEHWEAKIADFGLSRFKDETKTMTSCGSPLWAAPEVLRGERFGEQCDVFSYAIVVWEIMHWDEPYRGLDWREVTFGVANKGLRPKISSGLSPAVAALLKAMWAPEPTARPKFTEVCEKLDEELELAKSAK